MYGLSRWAIQRLAKLIIARLNKLDLERRLLRKRRVIAIQNPMNAVKDLH